MSHTSRRRKDTGNERTGDHPALPSHRKPKTWRCRVCGYYPLDKKEKFCVSCGRDWYGNPGIIPHADRSSPRDRQYEGSGDPTIDGGGI